MKALSSLTSHYMGHSMGLVQILQESNTVILFPQVLDVLPTKPEVLACGMNWDRSPLFLFPSVAFAYFALRSNEAFLPFPWTWLMRHHH